MIQTPNGVTLDSRAFTINELGAIGYNSIDEGRFKTKISGRQTKATCGDSAISVSSVLVDAGFLTNMRKLYEFCDNMRAIGEYSYLAEALFAHSDLMLQPAEDIDTIKVLMLCAHDDEALSGSPTDIGRCIGEELKRLIANGDPAVILYPHFGEEAYHDVMMEATNVSPAQSITVHDDEGGVDITMFLLKPDVIKNCDNRGWSWDEDEDFEFKDDEDYGRED